jgi:hypothetical protein
MILLLAIAFTALGMAMWRAGNPPSKERTTRLMVEKTSRPTGGHTLTYYVNFKDGTLNYFVAVVENGSQTLLTASTQDSSRVREFSGKRITPQVIETFDAVRRLAEEKVDVAKLPAADSDRNTWQPGFPHQRTVDLDADPPRLESSSKPKP